jgi:hypothetical protein
MRTQVLKQGCCRGPMPACLRLVVRAVRVVPDSVAVVIGGVRDARGHACNRQGRALCCQTASIRNSQCCTHREWPPAAATPQAAHATQPAHRGSTVCPGQAGRTLGPGVTHACACRRTSGRPAAPCPGPRWAPSGGGWHPGGNLRRVGGWVGRGEHTVLQRARYAVAAGRQQAHHRSLAIGDGRREQLLQPSSIARLGMGDLLPGRPTHRSRT